MASKWTFLAYRPLYLCSIVHGYACFLLVEIDFHVCSIIQIYAYLLSDIFRPAIALIPFTVEECCLSDIISSEDSGFE